MSFAPLYAAVYRGTVLTEWEKRALCPKDLARTPKEAHSRQRIAEVMRALRREEPVLLDKDQVLQELKDLVVSQTKSLNTFDAFTLSERQLLAERVAELNDWSRLVKLLGQVRTQAMRRYHEQKRHAA